MNADIKTQLKETYASWNGVNSLYAAWAKKNGLTYHSMFILYAIYNEQDYIYQRKICEDWSVPKQTASSILRSLEQDDLIFYLPDERDKRNKLIKFTNKGLIYAESILSRLIKIESTVFEKIDSNMRQTMVEGNTLYYTLLKQVIEDENIS